MNFPAFRLRRPAGSALVVACLALLLITPAHAARTARRTVKHRPAASSATKSVVPPAAVPTTTAGAAGMIVAIDPESGALVPPTAEQVRTLTAAERTGLMRTSAGLTEVRLPNGAVMVDLQGRFMEYSLAQLDPAGCPHFFGVNDETVLLALLSRYAPASTPACEEK
jgi:hypothetical protein